MMRNLRLAVTLALGLCATIGLAKPAAAERSDNHRSDRPADLVIVQPNSGWHHNRRSVQRPIQRPIQTAVPVRLEDNRRPIGREVEQREFERRGFEQREVERREVERREVERRDAERYRVEHRNSNTIVIPDRRYENRQGVIHPHHQRRHQTSNQVWIAGHYEPGFLGLGRKWVEGHWETRR
jgi:hypothetical protein